MQPYGKRHGDDGAYHRERGGRRTQCPCCPPKFLKGDRTMKRRARAEGRRELRDQRGAIA